MKQEPALTDFKTETDINYAIANAFIYVFNIERSKFLLDTLMWSAEQTANEHLLQKSAPWNKGFSFNLNTGNLSYAYENPSDSPSGDETKYITRDKTLEEYFPKRLMNPFMTINNVSYRAIDDRVALFALSWWIMFLSTKNGFRMVYWPHSSQLSDSKFAYLHQNRSHWYIDSVVSEYYKSIGIDKTEFAGKAIGDTPSIWANIKDATDSMIQIHYLGMKTLLEAEGLKFVLWLYNYIKSNNNLVPYDFSNEYMKSLGDTPTYRGGRKLDVNQYGLFPENSFDKQPISSMNINPSVKHSATGISQTGLKRDSNSCGILIRNTDVITEASFTNYKLKEILRKKFRDPFKSKIEKVARKIVVDVDLNAIDSNYVTRYFQTYVEEFIGKQKIETTQSSKNVYVDYVIFVSNQAPNLEKHYEVYRNNNTGEYSSRLVAIVNNGIKSRIEEEAYEYLNTHLLFNTRIPRNYVGTKHIQEYLAYGYPINNSVKREITIVEEDHKQWSTRKSR